jgi:hypothetical protein
MSGAGPCASRELFVTPLGGSKTRVVLPAWLAKNLDEPLSDLVRHPPTPSTRTRACTEQLQGLRCLLGVPLRNKSCRCFRGHLYV